MKNLKLLIGAAVFSAFVGCGRGGISSDVQGRPSTSLQTSNALEIEIAVPDRNGVLRPGVAVVTADVAPYLDELTGDFTALVHADLPEQVARIPGIKRTWEERQAMVRAVVQAQPDAKELIAIAFKDDEVVGWRGTTKTLASAKAERKHTKGISYFYDTLHPTHTYDIETSPSYWCAAGSLVYGHSTANSTSQASYMSYTKGIPPANTSISACPRSYSCSNGIGIVGPGYMDYEFANQAYAAWFQTAAVQGDNPNNGYLFWAVNTMNCYWYP